MCASDRFGGADVVSNASVYIVMDNLSKKWRKKGGVIKTQDTLLHKGQAT